ncbi:MAG: IS66 family transposase [Acidobacteria bacterium]|nr:IS66 family transposase [Acidobacteriota bacterium]
MKEEDQIPKIDPAEIETLIAKIEQNKLGEEEKRLVARMLRTLLLIVAGLQEKKITLLRIRDLIFGKRSEKRKGSAGGKDEEKNSESNAGKSESPEAPGTEKNELAPSDAKPKKPGHGRRPAAAYPGAEKVICRHTEITPGSRCLNPRCTGRVFPVKRPHEFIQFKGNPAITATYYLQEVMRCTLCDKEHEAPLPEGVKPQRWDETADASIAIKKHLAAVPYNRTTMLQLMCGIPLSQSTQFERCSVVAEILLPIYKQMVKEAANAKIIYGDDTGVKILELMAENEGKKKGERTGMHTTGIVAERYDGMKIALYFNGRRHTGENVAALLRWRCEYLGPVLRMGDGLAANWSGDDERIECHCMVHARRKFWEIAEIYPVQCGYVLMRIGEIYQNEDVTKEKGMSDDERLDYHQKHSGPLMEELRKWMELEISEKRVEPNSSLGKAISYFQKNYPELCAFLKYPGAPLDNNSAERVLKPAAMIRKNSSFYKTSYGAAVSGIILSVLMTCRLNGGNVWEYLVSVLRRPSEVKNNPAAFLPWVAQGAGTGEAEEGRAA